MCGAAGLLRSGLLKRFESSAHAFRLSLERMLAEHDRFLAALDAGRVLTVAELREIDADDEAFDLAIVGGGVGADARAYDTAALRAAVVRDQIILAALARRMAEVDEAADPKLNAVATALHEIATEAAASPTAEQQQRDRKVLIFSYYADTVVWLLQALRRRIASDPALAPYAGRIAAVGSVGNGAGLVSRDEAVFGFAPKTAAPGRDEPDRYDVLLATDVLAEGMNLQQCRHIIDYDLPWNPMRLVQRHGRIDRIGSPHPRVFLRTVFPAQQLDALLRLETRILRKLAQAARTIGVGTAPLQDAEATQQVFAETHAEIERLAAGDPSLYERGGTPAGAQTGEEYRQRLRAALEVSRQVITTLPGQVGSGLRRGSRSGVFFCAEVPAADRTRTFLRFVPATEAWQPDDTKSIVHEVGTCLRLIECSETDALHMPDALGQRVFDFWQAALGHIMAEWRHLSDPASLQPPVRALNKRIAAFIRANQSPDLGTDQVARALDILEAPWPRREEAMLREQWECEQGRSLDRAKRLTHWILGTGLEPFSAAPPLPDAGPDDVWLVCWMAIDRDP